MNAATTSAYVTIAVPIAVADTLNVDAIASIDTCSVEMLNTIRICAIAITTSGIHDACSAGPASTSAIERVLVAMAVPRPKSRRSVAGLARPIGPTADTAGARRLAVCQSGRQRPP